MNAGRVELRTCEYPSPEESEHFNSKRGDHWLFSSWAKKIGAGGVVFSSGLLTSCGMLPGPGVSEIPPTPQIVEEAIIPIRIPELITESDEIVIVTRREIARAIKRVDEIRYLTREYLREPIGDDLIKRFKDFDEENLATMLKGTNPRGRQHFLVYQSMNTEGENNYVLTFTNTYEENEKLSKFEIKVHVNPAIISGNGGDRIAVGELRDAASGIYRLSGNPSWVTFDRTEGDETVTIARTLGINSNGRTTDVSIDTLGRGNFTVVEPFFTPLE